MLSRLPNKVYIFSTAPVDSYKIVACVEGGRRRAVGKDIFEYLDISHDESEKFKSVLNDYGKDNYVTVCGKEGLRAVFFFQYFASGSSLCLALVPSLSASEVACAMDTGFFEGFQTSPALMRLADKDKNPLSLENSEARLHLSLALGQIMRASELKLQYTAQSAEDIRLAAEGVALLVGVSLDFDTYLAVDDHSLVATDEVFDGRFCAATLFVFAMIAAKYSTDRSFKLTVVRGRGGVGIMLFFRKSRVGKQEAFERLKAVAHDHDIIFETVNENDRMGICFIPLYQDEGFVGVKGSEELFNLIRYREMF